jgi:hypothetical protein
MIRLTLWVLLVLNILSFGLELVIGSPMILFTPLAIALLSYFLFTLSDRGNQ